MLCCWRQLCWKRPCLLQCWSPRQTRKAKQMGYAKQRLLETEARTTLGQQFRKCGPYSMDWHYMHIWSVGPSPPLVFEGHSYLHKDHLQPQLGFSECSLPGPPPWSVRPLLLVFTDQHVWSTYHLHCLVTRKHVHCHRSLGPNKQIKGLL